MKFPWSRQGTSPKNAAQRRLSENATTAFWGTTCRTSSFHRDGDIMNGNYHLRAIMRHGKDNEVPSWTVYRIAKREMHPGEAGNPGESRTVEKSGLDLFAMLNYLAEFEQSQKTLRAQIVNPAEKETLKFDHFEAFGRREGLVFDLHGLPHETDKGMIVTEGEFLERDQAALVRDYKTPVDKVTALFSAVSSGDIARELFGARVRDISIDTVLSDMSVAQKKYEQFQKFEAPLNTVLEFYQAILEGKINDDTYTKIDGRYVYKTYEVALFLNLDIAMKALKDIRADFDTDQLQKGMDVLRMALAVDIARIKLCQFMNKTSVSTEDIDGIRKVLSHHIESIMEPIKKLGLQDVSRSQFEASVLKRAVEMGVGKYFGHNGYIHEGTQRFHPHTPASVRQIARGFKEFSLDLFRAQDVQFSKLKKLELVVA